MDAARVKVAFELEPQKTAVYEDVSRRVDRATRVERGAPFDALVTDSVEAASRAAEEGKHALLDAPPAAIGSLPVSGSSRRVVPAHPWRFRPAVRAIKGHLDAGKLGAPGLLRIHRWEHCREPSRRQALETRAVGEIDLASWLFGEPPETVYALEQAAAAYLQIHLGFPAGGMALLDFASGLPEGGDYASLSLIGSKGAAYADDHHDRQLLFRGGAPTALRTGHGTTDLSAQLQAFVDAVHHDQNHSVTLDDTRAALRVAAAVAESARSSRVVGLHGGAP